MNSIISSHHILYIIVLRIIGNNRIRYDLPRFVGTRLNWPWSSDFDPPPLLPLCGIVMPMLPLWKTKRRQLPRGSNLAPSTETMVIACCCCSNESVEMPYKIAYKSEGLSDAQCRRPGWTRDTWGQGPYKQCHCVRAADSTGRMYQKRSVLPCDGIMIGCGSLLHENGDQRWDPLSASSLKLLLMEYVCL